MRIKRLFGEKVVDDSLDVGAGVHLSEEVGGGGGVDAVGEEDIDEVGVGISPDHGAGETGMAEAGGGNRIGNTRRSARRRIVVGDTRKIITSFYKIKEKTYV